VRRLLSTILLAAAAGALTPAAAAQAAAAPGPAAQRFGVRLVDVPVAEAGNPRALRYIIDYLPPGTVIRRRILILNEEPHTARFTVYPDAAQITDGYFVGGMGETRSELTGWIGVQHATLTLGPGASATDLVTIAEPRTATRGEHYGVIWVQQSSLAHTASGVAVDEVARVGIRLYLAVGPGGMPPTRFAITSVAGRRTARGQPAIVARVRNTGERAVDLSGTAHLSAGPGGTSAGPFDAGQIVTLAPGQSGSLTFALGNRIPNGPWTARVTLLSGLTSRTSSAVIQFSGGPATPWTKRLLLAAPGSALVIAVLFGAGVLVRRSRRPRRVPA
jgi:hypothetical protein